MEDEIKYLVDRIEWLKSNRDFWQCIFDETDVSDKSIKSDSKRRIYNFDKEIKPLENILNYIKDNQ